MNKSRIESLSDGVFAIVMTLLIVEIKVPELDHGVSNAEIWHSLFDLTPLFLSYLLSFAVITTYWVSHNFLITFMAKTIDRTLIYLNMLFLLAVGLIPFSANLLGFYTENRLAVVWYGIHIFIIACILYLIRFYIISNPNIEVDELSPQNQRYAKIRVWVPIIMSFFGVLIAFINPNLSLIFYIFPLVISLIPGSVAFLDGKIGKFLGR